MTFEGIKHLLQNLILEETTIVEDEHAKIVGALMIIGHYQQPRIGKELCNVSKTNRM